MIVFTDREITADTAQQYANWVYERYYKVGSDYPVALYAHITPLGQLRTVAVALGSYDEWHYTADDALAALCPEAHEKTTHTVEIYR